MSWAWRDAGAVERLLRLDGLVPAGQHRPVRILPAAGGAVRANYRLPGLGQVGAFPGASLLFVEGRTHELATRNEKDHALGKVREVADVEARLPDDLGGLLGAAPAGPAELRRADLTGELVFERGEDGRQLLDLLDRLHSPLYKTSPVRERGGPGLETVYWRTPRRSTPVLRAYDKGIESGTAAAGERIRIERQVRYGGQQRPSLAQWLGRDLAALFSGPVRRWLPHGIAAGTADELMRCLTDAAVIWPSYWAAGRSWASPAGRAHVSLWPARKVERVLGTLAVAATYGAAWPAWSDKQRQRRMHEVRELGLLLTPAPVVVDVDAAIGSLCDLWQRQVAA